MNRVRIISFTEAGYKLSCRMRESLRDQEQTEVILYSGKKQIAEKYGTEGVQPVSDGLQAWCQDVFTQSELLIFIGACGIAVRTIAPFVCNKYSDPAVLVADECGMHVISLLSGHLGGGNAWTKLVAEGIGADPVITTASDVNGRLAVDVWAQKQNLRIMDRALAKYAAAVFVTGQKLPFYAEPGVAIRGALPQEYQRLEEKEAFLEAVNDKKTEEIAGIVVSVHGGWPENVLVLVPQTVILGIGCRKNKAPEELRLQVYQVLETYQILPESICKMASIDLKAKEPAICQLAAAWKVPFETFSSEALLAVPGEYPVSEFVKKTTGVGNVCERAAVAALPEEEQKQPCWICHKQAENGVTVAMIALPFLSVEARTL